MTDNHVLDGSPYALSEDEKAPLFKQDLLDELRHHYDNNALYRRFCLNRGFDPHDFQGTLTDIPHVPVHVFKTLGPKLASVQAPEIRTQLQSSATSGRPSTVMLDKITARRQTRAMARVMRDVLGPERRHFCILDIDPLSPKAVNLGARGAAIRGYLNFASSASYFIDSDAPGAPLVFDEQAFVEHVSGLTEPPVIFGFTFVLYSSVIRPMLEHGVRLSLPPGTSVIHIGGWKKLEAERVSKEQFNNDVATVLGIDPQRVVDIYGFTEQMGLNYPDCTHGWKHVHNYSEVIVRDEHDLSVCPDGKPGLLHFLSPLPHSYPGNSVLTDDIGVLESGTCGCGRSGRRFRVLGRAAKAEVRGCGDIMADKVATIDLSSVILGGRGERGGKLEIHHGHLSTQATDSPAQLRDLIAGLETQQKWLAEQPVELIIGLLGAARERWQQDSRLEPYQRHGLDFLISWADPTRLRSLLDTALHGRRGHLDMWLPRDDCPGGALRAFPRGLVSHWLSGNVPLLGMFAIIQAWLTKNVNLVKIAAEGTEVLPALLDGFRGLTYVSPGGQQISGDEFLKTIALVYFDRNQRELAEIFSSAATARIAWGGRAAVEAVTALPRRYDCQDILFGPKLSMMMIGKERLVDERSLRKLARRAATDSSVFDQFACASPHTIFVEKGAEISPHLFAEQLAGAMETALVRLPAPLPDVGQANKIRSAIAEYDFVGDSWADEDLRWTVLFDEGSTLPEPTYHRVITVRAVDDLRDVVGAVDDGIQTVGFAVDGARRLDLARELAARGAVRFPEIGRMTHFDSPWDGIYMADRLVRWVTLGGPV